MHIDSIDHRQVSQVTVSPDRDGQRLDNFLMFLLRKAPKALVYRIIRKGEVRINKKRAKPDTRLKAGDVVRVPPIRLPENGEAPCISGALQSSLNDAVVFEDNCLIAINKPHGLAVHGGSGLDFGLIEALRVMRPDAPFLELVHRLDRDTSGIILVAKQRSVLLALQRLLVAKSGINKQYLALVHGHWPEGVRDVLAPLKKVDRPNGERMVIVHESGKASHTRIRKLAQGGHYSLLAAQPVTGRTHQIRVHCQVQGHPISGDTKYRTAADESIDEQLPVRRLCLHAHTLSFRHPKTGEHLTLTAPLENHMANILTQAGCVYDL